jgi:hypothetical protein
MRGKYLHIVILSLASCIDPISFDIPNDSTFLVVDGFITDDIGPHRIKLSRSAKYENTLNDSGEGEVASVSGAILSIVDNLGTIIPLQEVFDGAGREGDTNYSGKIGYNGNYETVESFKGIVGNQYHLQIEVNGETYQSSKETLKASSLIDTVTYSHVSIPYLNESNKVAYNMGLEFYADFKSTSDATHYKWDWENTFILDDYMTLNLINADSGDFVTYDIPPLDPKRCYVNEFPIGEVNIMKNEVFGFTYQNYPVNFVPVDFKFNYKYSMNLILYSMSDEASKFWNQVSSQASVTGSIFDPAPTGISGNIQNVNGGKEVVLGYFGAFGKSEKRVFIDSFETGILIGLGSLFYSRNEACFNAANFSDKQKGVFVGPPEFCYNCFVYPGSQSEKPDFWE